MKSINKNQTQLRTLFFGLLCVVAGVMCFAQGFSHGSAAPAVSQSTGERQGVSPPSVIIPIRANPQFASLTPRYITKRIADIEVGEEVVAKDPDTGNMTTKTVANVFRKVSDHLRILQIRNPLTDELQTIETTDDHPFWVAGRSEWIDAKDLKLGDRLDGVDSSVAILESTRRELHPDGIPVFNFEVEDYHTYFVRAHGSRGPPILTHNTECGDGFVSLAAVEQAARDASIRLSTATQKKEIALGFNELFRRKGQVSLQPIGEKYNALDEFAAEVGASSYNRFGQIGLSTEGSRWIERALRQGDVIHFNLDGFRNKGTSIVDAVEKGRAFGFRHGNATNYELSFVLDNLDVRGKTIFYRGGKVLENPERFFGRRLWTVPQ